MPNQLVVEEIDEHEAYFQIIGSRFPHIEERLRLMWGTPEVAPYLQNLTISNRSDRQGFPPEVFRALNALLHMQMGAGKGDVWGGVSKRKGHG